MLNPYIILLSLFIADRRRHRESSAVGYADSITAIGATHSKEWIIDYINHRLDVYDRQLPKLIDKNAIERNVAVQEELHSILKHIYF